MFPILHNTKWDDGCGRQLEGTPQPHLTQGKMVGEVVVYGLLHPLKGVVDGVVDRITSKTEGAIELKENRCRAESQKTHKCYTSGKFPTTVHRNITSAVTCTVGNE